MYYKDGLMFLAKSKIKLVLEILKESILKVQNKPPSKQPIEEMFLEILMETTFQIKIELTKSGKCTNNSLDSIKKRVALQKLAITRTRTKPKIKTRKLLFYKDEILNLKNEGMSYRELEYYLKRNHKFNINYSTIAKEMKNWKKNLRISKGD